MHISRFFILVVGVLVMGLTACSNEHVLQGECKSVFDGDICTFGTMVGDDVVEFGATVPLSTIENAPAEGEMVFPPPTIARIALPSEVAARIGIDHLGLNWEMHGHPPGPFLTPHFDFHFNTISGADIEAIDCADLSKPESVPAAYTLPDLEIPGLGTLVGLCVPGMGMHAISEDELNATVLFGASMIVGYYAQDVIFVEPMIAQAKLLDEKSFTMNVPALEDAGESVTWPVSFEAVYDEEERAYRFVFSMTSAG